MRVSTDDGHLSGRRSETVATTGKLVGDLLREGKAVALSGLSKTEVGHFIASRTGWAADERLLADLYRATDGNALYVEGVVRLLESEEKLNQARTQAKRSNG